VKEKALGMGLDDEFMLEVENTSTMEISDISTNNANGLGLSSAIFKFVRNRIPTRIANKIADAQFAQLGLYESTHNGLAGMRAYRSYSVSTDDIYGRVPETPPPVYRSKTSLHTTSASVSSVSSSEDESDVGQSSRPGSSLRSGLRRRATARILKGGKDLNFVAGTRAGVRVGFANQGQPLSSTSAI
jgi:hypothetical protein